MSITKKISAWNRARKRKRRSGNHPFQFAVLGIMKNEGLNIDEWVQHYLDMGADKIFLIDNGSDDDCVEKVLKWKETGKVDLIIRPERHKQREHYDFAFKHFEIKKYFRWLLIADLDEFWFCPDNKRIANTLESFSEIDVIYCNMRMFGSSGIDQHPKSIRESFVHCMPKCRIPDDHISPRRSALFVARSVLMDIRDGAQTC